MSEVRIRLGEAPDVDGAPMAGVEMQVIREGLGLSRAELLALLNRGSVKQTASVSSVYRWEGGKDAIQPWLEATLAEWEDAQRGIVDELVAGLGDERDVVLTIPRDGAGGFPGGYWRAVAWLVRSTAAMARYVLLAG